MEKMRRARINDSLNELKCLVLEAMKKDVSDNCCFVRRVANYWFREKLDIYIFALLVNVP